MKNITKKLVSISLALVLLLGLLCVSAGAVDVGVGGQDSPWGQIDPSRLYNVNIAEGDKENITSNYDKAPAGTTVTITVAPGATGVTGLNVKDMLGNPVKLTQTGDNTYTFTMPAADVTVKGEAGEALITDDHFAYIIGYTDGTFGPDKSLTRAAAATIFYRLLVNKSAGTAPVFSDVKTSDWFYTEVSTLAAKGIITGYPDGTFKPNDPVSRAEFCAMAARFFSLSAGNVNFTDVPTTHWAYKYIASAAAKEWIVDGKNEFKPDGDITRKEVVGIVNNMLSREADAEYIKANLDKMTTFTDVPEKAEYYLDVMEAANGHDFKDDANGIETWLGLKK